MVAPLLLPIVLLLKDEDAVEEREDDEREELVRSSEMSAQSEFDTVVAPP